MNKADLLQCIVAQLSHDLEVLFNAAKTAHEAATHSENLPDNKYDTLALEASYVAQGQANRASEIRQAMEVYKQLKLVPMDGGEIRITALVRLEAEDGASKTIFIGPLEGGLKIAVGRTEVVVITPGSPLGSELMGKTIGDAVQVGIGPNRTEYEIAEVC
ncbi:GreA/GreB family elongation factor [Geotalea toluenoxydans]|uniref:GreA/GreB family elongation factor n=1 Tax=Geotalea toluenoxydans TaxID=421624 RepID=UPI0006D249E2|nr:GreA/GreB family elongation factor [Geotalea toluenoxydans]